MKDVDREKSPASGREVEAGRIRDSSPLPNLMATDESKVNRMDYICYSLGLTWRLLWCLQLVNI